MAENELINQRIIVEDRAVFCRILPPADTTPPGDPPLPVILLHGLGCSSDVWVPFLKALRQRESRRLVIAVDMPGCGHSEGAGGPLTMGELGAWTVALMDRLGIEKAHLAAHSMGCQVALAMAHGYPERTGGLILVGPTLGTRMVPFWRYLLGVLINFFLEPARFNALLVWMWLETGLALPLAETQTMFADHPLSLAREIKTDGLVVRGQCDAIVPDAAARRLAAALTNGQYVRVSGLSHALQFTSPHYFAKMALEFLSKSERSEGVACGS